MAKRAEIKPLPEAALLRSLFEYRPQTGELIWRVYRGPMAPGYAAGTPTRRGYLHIGISGVYYLAHRLIWKMVTGNDPPVFIDHIDGDRTNNRLANLRLADESENLRNSRLRRDNTSGFKGVKYCPLHKKWRAKLNIDKRTHHIGYFDTPEAASAARNEAAKHLHGAFARSS